MNWPTGFVIRPATDPEAAAAEVADTVTGRRFRWRPEALAAAILRERLAEDEAWARTVGTAAPEERVGLEPGWRHWLHRGWRPSDTYYVASRRWDYADSTDPDDAIRDAALRGYAASDGPPPQEVLPDGPVVELGPAAPPGPQRVSRLLVERRSGRAYVPRPTPLGRLSGLLWYGLEEIRARRERTDPEQPLSYLDSYGSAWDVHLCVYDVAGVPPGTYRYDILRHRLIGIRPGDHREAMIDVLQGMHSPATAAWTLGLVADFPRYQWRYRHEHGLRRLYLEAGLIGQELIVLGASYGLGTLVTPAQKDRPYLDLHGLPDDRYGAVYTLTMGQSRGSAGVDFNEESITQIPAEG